MFNNYRKNLNIYGDDVEVDYKGYEVKQIICEAFFVCVNCVCIHAQRCAFVSGCCVYGTEPCGNLLLIYLKGQQIFLLNLTEYSIRVSCNISKYTWLVCYINQLFPCW